MIRVPRDRFAFAIQASNANVFLSLNSHAVSSVVLLGASQHAVPPVRLLLDVLEEVRRAEDAQQSRSSRGENLPQPSKQCELDRTDRSHS